TRRPASPVRLLLALGLAIAAAGAWAAADPNKVLRIASPDIETLDPHQYNDSPSFDVLTAIFEGLYEWDYVASPTKLAPVEATALPEITDGARTWTIRVKPGIHFTDDPAFRGKPREVTADDFVYSLKRWLDPNLRRGGDPIVTDLIVGAREIVDAARKSGGKLDYDRPIAGLRALDRYSVQLRLKETNYPNIENFLTTRVVAREVVEAAGGDIRERPVGTGPYRLREWKRGSRIVLEANPTYRSVRFPESADPALAPMVKEMRGKSLPQIGVVEINVIEEDVTRLLEFDRGRLDVIVLRGEIASRLLTGNKLKPEYAARGIVRLAVPEPYLFSIYVNVADPSIGGMTNDRIALRRAIALGFDVENLIKVLYAGLALPANQLVPPGVSGHDPEFAPRQPHDPRAANALLDRFGYDKRDPDGYRRAPDGKPLTLTLSLRTGAISREIQTQWKKDMDAIGLRMDYRLTPFQDVIKDLEAGKFQLYFGGYGGIPSGYAELMQLYGKEPPAVNASRFKSSDYDRAMEEYLKSARDAEQIATARRMSEIARTFVPIIPAIFRLESDFVQPWIQGYRPQMFQTYWKYVDIDLARQRQLQGK
ncbi:MAG TPA: ABC transporter substrate-binding protein, partial [Casimicrobiaceae bacterium]|nr:ABC transporter substrate-binding protein [Casimicrobiaceae bacterium]